MSIFTKPPAIFVLVLALGCGLIAGTFFAFSVFIMRGLDQRPAPEAIGAMQSINVAVINPVFMAVFMGNAAASLAAVAWAIAHRGHAATPWVLSGAMLYLVGCFSVTVAGNVPLNNVLALAKAGDANAPQIWSDFAAPWMAWNHLRTLCSLGACASFIVALTKLSAQNP